LNWVRREKFLRKWRKEWKSSLLSQFFEKPIPTRRKKSISFQHQSITELPVIFLVESCWARTSHTGYRRRWYGEKGRWDFFFSRVLYNYLYIIHILFLFIPFYITPLKICILRKMIENEEIQWGKRFNEDGHCWQRVKKIVGGMTEMCLMYRKRPKKSSDDEKLMKWENEN
jgi:hypothetical protein